MKHTETMSIWVYRMGYILGLLEMILSIGLLLKYTQKTAAILLIIMHIVLLIMIGPYGINYNSIVWGWNIMMIVYLFIGVIQNPSLNISVRQLFTGWNKLIVILFAIMPMFNLIGYWDYYPSFSLYTGKPPRMFVCIKKIPQTKSIQHFGKYSLHACDSNSLLISMSDWGVDEMNASPYPEIRVYKGIKEQLLKQYPECESRFFVCKYYNGRIIQQDLK
ncbi:MAG: hypothetical protein WDM71_00885 [Ferruginibacter sp.]